MYLRGNPRALINLDTKGYTEYPCHGMWRTDSSEGGEATREIGFYWHTGSGSYNSFYDGEEHWFDTSTSSVNSQRYNKYLFIYKSEV